MIIYSATCEEFSQHVLTSKIDELILVAFKNRLGYSTSKAEIESWRNSLGYMNNVLTLAHVPPDANVAIEYRVPLTAKRVDFILAGVDDAGRDSAVIVELKQWSKVEVTDKDAIVLTALGGGVRETTHPSYQAWTYAALIRDFNSSVQDGDIRLQPCAWLHNCDDGAAVNDSVYAEHTARAPVFIRKDTELLAEFLKRHVHRGDRNGVLYRIDSGKLRPSKNLSDELSSLMQGNREFELIDDQKIVYENALALSDRSQVEGRRHVLIVRGGPGTGKTVVAINLLVELTKRERVAQYVSRNAAPRAVYAAKLAGTMKKSRIGNLFRGSGAYLNSPAKGIDALIVDEAHRLNEKSGLYGNLGENQIYELVVASAFSVFFVDDRQRVTLKDIGSAAEIRAQAEKCGAQVHELELASQFRCNGSDGYLAWVDHALQIAETANTDLNDLDYEFNVCATPTELRDSILAFNSITGRARMVVGYCWDWKGKKDSSIEDIQIPEHGFSARWNLDKDGGLWVLQPDSVHEVGCIHTCQGLELEHVGVIIGPDLVVRNGRVVTDATKRSSQDRSIHGYKKWFKEEPEEALAAADRVIRNTYRTLLTRGQQGCSIYCTDRETNDYFRELCGSVDNPMWLKAAEPKEKD